MTAEGNCQLTVRHQELTDDSGLCVQKQEARPGQSGQSEWPPGLSPSSRPVSLLGSSRASCCRNVGVSRPGPGSAEGSLHHDEDRGGKRGPEAQVEMAADAAEQGGWYPLAGPEPETRTKRSRGPRVESTAGPQGQVRLVRSDSNGFWD